MIRWLLFLLYLLALFMAFLALIEAPGVTKPFEFAFLFLTAGLAVERTPGIKVHQEKSL